MWSRIRLNAPYGAWCFLTERLALICSRTSVLRLNAPYGARCFLIPEGHDGRRDAHRVLMRLMVLGAF